jgi:HlyD family secretion protein
MIRHGGRACGVVMVGAALLLCARAGAAETVVGEGVVRAEERATIRTVTLGAIRRLPVREGETVRRGQLLVETESETVQAVYETAVAEVRRASAALAEAQVAVELTTREYERNSRVPDLITVKELDLSRDAMRSAQALLEVRREELTRAERQRDVATASLGQTRILAPFDGMVSRLYLREGDTAKIAETPVLDLLSLATLFVEVALPLPYLRRVRPGTPVTLDVESETTAIRRTVAGTVRLVYPEIDPTTRMFRVKVDVPTDGMRVLPGMFAKVRIDVR